MTDLVALKEANEKRWEIARMNRNFVSVARALVSAKSRYVEVGKETGVPWYFIAVVHERESSQNWTRSLAQGDPWNKISVHVPAGRGPFNSWEAAACDALVNCPPFAANNHDWSIGWLLTMLEGYNGYGYAARGVPSPYLWAGTDQYKTGKFIRDGFFDPTVVDQQLGCAGLIMAMMALDPMIVTVPRPSSLPPPKAAPPAPAPSFWTTILNAIRSIFKRG